MELREPCKDGSNVDSVTSVREMSGSSDFRKIGEGKDWLDSSRRLPESLDTIFDKGVLCFLLSPSRFVRRAMWK